MKMLTELCQELRNWFDRDLPKYFGEFTISDGQIQNVSLQSGQYFRIIGSLFNDGVHKYEDEENPLVDETFKGSIWSMAIPPAVIELADEIDNWLNVYGDTVLSPYTSESFGGYTYSKGASAGGNGSSSGLSWTDIFRSKLNRWRKI